VTVKISKPAVKGPIRMGLPAPTAARNGDAPRCDHLDQVRQVQANPTACAGCLASGDSWLALRLCLSCGWVACSDASSNQHAKAHYQETDHPVVAACEPGSTWRWCYVHQRTV
jgi:uncharacterized UBP type Zn finger protein